MLRIPEFIQLLIGISTSRYLPPSGTAGLALSLVRGKSLVPAPPPMIIANIRSVAGVTGTSLIPIGSCCHDFKRRCAEGTQQASKPCCKSAASHKRDGEIFVWWRELIKKVWEADPLWCPKCSRKMRIVSLIDLEDVIERIAISGSAKRECACIPAPTRRRNDPRSVARRPLPRLRHRTGRGVLRRLKRPAAPECASRTPCSASPSPPAGVRARPVTRKSPVFDFRPTFVTLCPWKRTLPASDSWPTPQRAKSDFLSVV
jgi:hypothetical protein